MKILLVDDSMAMRKVHKRFLKKLPEAAFLEAGNHDQAMQLFDQHHEEIAILLLDRTIPGLDGMELLRALRADPRSCSLPIIMVTADSSRESVMEALAAGANDYIVKPFDAPTLLSKVCQHLGITPPERRETAL